MPGLPGERRARKRSRSRHDAHRGRSVPGIRGHEAFFGGAALAQGRSHQEIATGLVASLETVKSQVASILTKLEVGDRTPLVIVASESGFVKAGTAPNYES
ncbi:response regulator transcription factor [Demequina sediminicola]|uniref:response regulator transcription factor n=1 Tax=Demequina sediminicola TaxID=1095026 RepID=UPI0009E4215C